MDYEFEKWLEDARVEGSLDDEEIKVLLKDNFACRELLVEFVKNNYHDLIGYTRLRLKDVQLKIQEYKP